MKQTVLGLNLSVKKTPKRKFLEQMEQVVPWGSLVELVAPYYPEGRNGRPPHGIGSKPRRAVKGKLRGGKRKSEYVACARVSRTPGAFPLRLEKAAQLLQMRFLTPIGNAVPAVGRVTSCRTNDP